MLKDFLGEEVFEGGVVVCASPYFPTKWVKAIVRRSTGEGCYSLEYTDSKKRTKLSWCVSGGQFIGVGG